MDGNSSLIVAVDQIAKFLAAQKLVLVNPDYLEQCARVITGDKIGAFVLAEPLGSRSVSVILALWRLPNSPDDVHVYVAYPRIYPNGQYALTMGPHPVDKAAAILQYSMDTPHSNDAGQWMSVCLNYTDVSQLVCYQQDNGSQRILVYVREFEATQWPILW